MIELEAVVSSRFFLLCILWIQSVFYISSDPIFSYIEFKIKRLNFDRKIERGSLYMEKHTGKWQP
jgi:hypothetical protein